MKQTRHIVLIGGLALFGFQQVVAEPVCWSENGHCYEVITDFGTRWDEARVLAESMVHNGRQGHLATITSLAENEFICGLMSQTTRYAFSIGGELKTPTTDPKEGWEWVTGEPWNYTNWEPGQPGDNTGVDDVVGMEPPLAGCDWHDYFREESAFGGYIVEYSTPTASHYIDITSLPDINGNGSPELAALRMLPDRTPQVIIKDSDTKEEINTISFAASAKTPTGITALLDSDGNGYPDIAVLLVQPNGRGVVIIKDALDGARIDQIAFFGGGEWQAKAITSQDYDGDGVSEITVLAERKDGEKAVAQLKDAISAESLKWIPFPVD